MPAPPTDTFFTPPASYSPQKTLSRLDLRLDPHSDDSLDADIFNMAGTTSPSPYIKEEVDDMHYQNRFLSNGGFDMNPSYGTHQFGEAAGGINPSDLSMSGNLSMNNHFNSSSHVAQVGGGGFGDDELAESLSNFDQPQGFDHFGQENLNHHVDMYPHGNNGSVSTGHANMNQVFSHTPEDVPIHSPFVQANGFDFNQYQSAPQRMPFAANMPSGAMRPRIPTAMSRNVSDHRGPMSPKTPVINGLHLGTPDSGNFASQPIMTGMHRHKPSASTQWDGTPGSAHSWVDSPTQSPHNAAMHHQQISEVMHSAKHASLPAKVDMGQTQDAKKRRRRESHNLVERRRRDNINERIHDLSRLVPHHRLEDEKIRKHINNNGPLSPSMAATGMSPPQATSLLAGGHGRRAAGNITQGLPLEEKDKGPNKGDILNGSVSWTRDLMWFLDKQLKANEEMAARLRQLTGEEWRTDQTEEERRMRTELVDAMERNGLGNFKYSRGPGSGLRVPKHTNLAGEPLDGLSPQSLSPENTGGNNPSFWNNQSLKEEDEFHGMEMG